MIHDADCPRTFIYGARNALYQELQCHFLVTVIFLYFQYISYFDIKTLDCSLFMYVKIQIFTYGNYFAFQYC